MRKSLKKKRTERRTPANARPKPSRPHIDAEEEAENQKAGWNASDQQLLERLKKGCHEKGFSFASLESNPESDFTVFLDDLEGLPNLVVCAPALTPDQTLLLMDSLASRRFNDDMRIEVVWNFQPAPRSWLRPLPQTVAHFIAVPNPPVGLGQEDWVFVSGIKIIHTGAESSLQIVHLGMTRERAVWSFLLPHGLVPRRLIL